MIGFRNCDPRYPFLWETADQPSARWHGESEGPAQYFADTPDGAWAEFVRHEGLTDISQLAGVTRSLWAVELGEPKLEAVAVDLADAVGGVETYERCQAEARKIRDAGGTALRAPSAALKPGRAHGWVVSNGLEIGPARSGEVFVLFGQYPGLVGWQVVGFGQPPVSVFDAVQPLLEDEHKPVESVDL